MQILFCDVERRESLINKTEQEEKVFLQYVNGLLEKKYLKLTRNLENVSKDISEMKRYFWDNIADMDGAEKNSNRTQIFDVASSNENTVSIRNGLEKLIKSPYFARIDFKDQEEVLPVYIGIRGFREDVTQKTLIYDWRAPISSVFYDFEIGPVSFKTPEGLKQGELQLKRQYKINHGQMEYMIESNVSIDDEILQKELSSTSDEKMKNIVATIQKEQNEIIRNEEANVLIIQGAAGSGKTSIALHRIAFMLYRFKNTIKSSDMLVLSPNKVFGNYISNVLPELGEENMQEMGFEEIAREVLGSKVKFQTFALQVSELLETNDSNLKNRIEFKSSVSFYVDLKEYLNNLQKEYFITHDITIKGVTLSKGKIDSYLQGLPNMPLKDKIVKLAKDLPLKMKMLINHKDIEWQSSYGTIVKNKIIKMFAFKDIIEIYENFYKVISRPELFVRLPKNYLEYSDVFPLAFIKIFFEKVEDYGYVKHLLVDEMQDYTPIQYAVLEKLFKCKMTILGDAYQAVNPYSSSSLGKIRTVFNNSIGVTLCKSYRSTIEIAELAQSISPNPDIIPVERHGEKPAVMKCISESEQLDVVKKIIDDFNHSEFTNLGIICRTEIMSKDLYKNLNGIEKLHLLDFTSNEFKEGIIITNAHMSKGLEFDQVLIPNVSYEEYKTEMDQKMLYVACTRAMHKLNLTYIGTKTKWLEEKVNEFNG